MINGLLALLQSSSEPESVIQYEFVNYAPSLLVDFATSKTVKSALAQLLNLDNHCTAECISPDVMS